MLCRSSKVETFLQMKSKKKKKTPKVTKRRRNIFVKILLILAILVALVHTYYIVFGFTILSLGNPGITGNTITGEAVLNWRSLTITSRFILAGEWLAVLTILLYLLIKGRLTLEKDLVKERDLTGKAKSIQDSKSMYETDLDVLHNILKEKKILRISVVAKTFGIDIKTAMDWVKILEEGDIATLSYPTVGSPKVTINTYLEEQKAAKEAKKNKKKNLKEDGEKEK